MKQIGYSLKTLKKACFVIPLLLLFCGVFAQSDPVSIYTKKNDEGGINFYGDNSTFIPYWCKIEFPVFVNLQASVDSPYKSTLPPGSKEVYLFTIKRKTSAAYRYNYNYYYYKGDPSTARHDDSYKYILPFAHGTKHRVGQGYHGTFSHYGKYEYAIDFDMDIGTEICASRDGIVIEVKEDSNIHGIDPSYEKDSNYILIYHRDGSFCNYVHLKQYGAIVEPGDRVKTGQVIGYSGNTGRSNAPHLHFDVRIPTYDGILKVIPTTFLNHDGSGIALEEGIFYYSTDPGKPAFEVIFGRNIKNKDYANYLVSVPRTNSLKLRVEQIDNTCLFFIDNGFDRNEEVKTEFTLTNLVASKPVPAIVTVPPLSEVYLLLLRPKEPNEAWRYSYKYWWKAAP